MTNDCTAFCLRRVETTTSIAASLILKSFAVELVSLNLPPGGNHPVQVNVPAVHDQMLSGGVPGLHWRKQEYDSCRDLFRTRQTVAQRNLTLNMVQHRGRVFSPLQPGFILRGQNLRRQYRIRTNAIREQLGRPFAREGQQRTLGRGIAGGPAWPVIATLELMLTMDPRDCFKSGSP
jgi:hypothetical protein